MRFIIHFVLAMILLAPGLSMAKDDPWLSKRAGIWKEAGAHGYFLAEVSRSGPGLSPTDSVTISEYAYVKNTKKDKLVNRYTLPSFKQHGWIEDIHFRMIDSQRMLLVLDIETNINEAASIRMVYMLVPGGRFKLMQDAGEMKDIPFK